MERLVQWLTEANAQLDKLDGRTISRVVERPATTSDRTADSAEAIAAALRRRKIVRER